MLISETDIDKMNFKDTIPFLCEVCNKKFVRTKRNYYIGVIVRKRKNALCYCSGKCRDLSNRKRQTYTCEECKKEVIRKPSEINNPNKIFCSTHCSAVFHNRIRSEKSIISITCLHCGKIIQRKKHKVKNKKYFFCNPQCKSLYFSTLPKFNDNKILSRQLFLFFPKRKELVSLTCEMCLKEFIRNPKKNRKNKIGKNFCSKSCRMRWYNINKSSILGGKIRSKFEINIEEKLKITFPNIEIDFNNRKLLGYELDVFIPSMKLAFEFNGIHHYEPIRGNDRFNQITFKDNQKQKMCKDLGIELITIDIRKIKNMNEEKLLPFWQEIKEKIITTYDNLSITQALPRGGVII